ncbi:YccF domain-containing protein [Flaviaesturariibacter amylovorans]|uniref:YccF domain-containing protein n=1 Tax=Flaviaesturariibacter amylovorans TaxID=1084520 RepID=A0ABP8G7F2_9BACT
MNFLGNLVWLVFGGLLCALGYVLGGLVLCLTIIGIPFGLQCFKVAGIVLMPFGQRVVPAPGGDGPLHLLGNILWMLCGGIWTALSHILFGVLLCLTIIGIPFGRQHFKLVALSLMPFGRTVVPA